MTDVDESTQLALEPIDKFRAPEHLDRDETLLLPVIAFVDRPEASSTESALDLESRRARKLLVGRVMGRCTNDGIESRGVAIVRRRDVESTDVWKRMPGVEARRTVIAKAVWTRKPTEHAQGLGSERGVSGRRLPNEVLSTRRIDLQRRLDKVACRALERRRYTF